MADTDLYKQQNFGNCVGFGRRSALVMVDFTVGFNDPKLFGGGNIDAAIKRTVGLLEFFRAKRLPIAFTRVVYADDGSDAGVFCMKAPNLRMLTETHPAGQIVAELFPLKKELIVRKTQASAFFGTAFAPWLVQQGVDTLVVTGCTTSGCVRATAVDAVQNGFRPMVVREAVGDRSAAAHEQSLFDLNAKYADVVGLDETLQYMRTVGHNAPAH